MGEGKCPHCFMWIRIPDHLLEPLTNEQAEKEYAEAPEMPLTQSEREDIVRRVIAARGLEAKFKDVDTTRADIPYAKGGLNEGEYLNVLRQCEMIVHAWGHIKNTLSDRLCKYYVKACGTEEEHALAAIYERMDELDGELTANDLDLLMNRIKYFTEAKK